MIREDGGLAAESVRLRAGSAEALVAAELGANCWRFRVGTHDLFEPPPNREALAAWPSGTGCPILFPFPGQMPAGQYRYRGRDLQMPLNSPDGTRHAHGFAHWHSWKILDRSEAACTLRLESADLNDAESAGYPWPFQLTIRWSLTDGRLRAVTRLENTGDEPLPFGFGLHPYFLVDESATVELPATRTWPRQNGVPTGEPEPIAGPWRWAGLEAGGSVLLTGLPDAVVEARVGNMRLRFPGDRFGEVVLYRPPEPRRSVCLEPWTSVSSAARQLEPGTPHGLLVLPSGGTWDGWMEVEPWPSS